MHTRTTTLAMRIIRLSRMMALVVVVAMLPTRLANALPCGDKNAEMPQDLAKVLHKLRADIKTDDTTYFNKIIVPDAYDGASEYMLFELNKLFESASPSWHEGTWSNALRSDCEVWQKYWTCFSQTEALPATEQSSRFVHVGNAAGTLLKDAPRVSSTTVAKLRCREIVELLDRRVFYHDETYWRKVEVLGGEHPPGYVKNDDLVYFILGSVTFARVGGIWRIVFLGIESID